MRVWAIARRWFRGVPLCVCVCFGFSTCLLNTLGKSDLALSLLKATSHCFNCDSPDGFQKDLQRQGCVLDVISWRVENTNTHTHKHKHTHTHKHKHTHTHLQKSVTSNLPAVHALQAASISLIPKAARCQPACPCQPNLVPCQTT